MKNVKTDKSNEKRALKDLISVGNATLKDFEILGIKSVNSLLNKDPRKLYLRLCKATGKKHDICVEDVFRAAIAQAQNPNLSLEQCQWWYWSRIRKEEHASKN